jgi:hypothetical protein
MFAARAAVAAGAARLAQGADSDSSDGDDLDAELVEAAVRRSDETHRIHASSCVRRSDEVVDEGRTQPVLDEGDAIIIEDRPSKCSNRRSAIEIPRGSGVGRIDSAARV